MTFFEKTLNINRVTFRFISILTLVVLVINSYGQTIRVRDYTTHESVAFANAQNISSKVFFTSNEKGNILITSYNSGDTLLVTHTNYYPLYIYPQEFQETDVFYMLPRPSFLGPEVVIIGRQEKREDMPSQIEVIQAKEIEHKNIQNSADLLQSTGNVLIQKSQMGGGSPIVRGFEANRVLLVLDGVRMNNAIYRSGHLQNAITIDNNVLKDVEVLFGPGSVMYGSDALGGVVYYKTKDPRLSYDDSIQNVEAIFMQRYSSANQEKTFHFDFNVGYDKWGFLTSFSTSNFGDLRMGENRLHGDEEWGLVQEYIARINDEDVILSNPDPIIQKGTGYKQYDFLQKFLFEPTQNLKFTLNMNYSTSSDIPRFDALHQYKDGQLRWAEWYYGPQNRLLLSLKTDILKSTKIYDALHVIVSGQTIEEDRIKRKFGKSKRTIQEENVTVYALNIDLEKALKKKFQLYYGAEVTYNEVKSLAYNYDIVTEEQQAAITRYPNGGSTMNTGALYLGLNKKLLKKTNIKVGARYSNSSLHADFNENPFYNLPYSSIDFSNGALTGSFGVIHKLDSTWQVSLSIASGYRSPNVDDFGKIREKNGFVTIPNDELKPEYAYNNELAIQKSLFDNKTKISVVGYYTFLQDAIVQRDWLLDYSEYLMIEGDSARVVTNINASEAVLYGGNVSLGSKIGNHVFFKSTLNYTYGQDNNDDVPLSHIPPLFGSSEITYKGDHFTATLSSLYNGEKVLERYGTGSADNLEEALEDGTPAWWTLNLYTSFFISPRVKAQFAVENILDVHYKTFASGLSSPGRNFIIGLRGSF